MTPRLATDRVTAPDADPDRWMAVLHGIYGAGRNWASVARRFVRERPEWGALLVDLRMHGDSQGFAPPHTIRACADDLAALVADTGLDVDAALGHSFGGKVALLWSAEDAPAATWVVDSTPDRRTPDGSAWQMLDMLRAHPGPFADRADGIAAVESAGFPNPVAQWMATNLVPVEGGAMAWRIDVDAMDALMRDFFETDAWQAVERPPPGSEIHVVKAEESSVLTEEACARVEAAGLATERVHLHRVSGGHWVNADAPDELHALLVEHMP